MFRAQCQRYDKMSLTNDFVNICQTHIHQLGRGLNFNIK
jgi:hypothetical protein